MRRLPCLVVLLIALCASCAAFPKYQLGPAPTATELENDGSPEAQAGLFAEYALEYGDGHYTRPRAAPTTEAGRPVIRQAEADSQDVAEYLGSAPGAAEVYGGALLTFYRAADSGALYVLVDAGVLIAAIGVGLGTGAIAGATSGNPANFRTGVLVGGVGGLLVGALIAGLFDLGMYYIGAPLLTTAAQLEYARAAELFNQELKRRIEDNAHSTAAPVTAMLQGHSGAQPPRR